MSTVRGRRRERISDARDRDFNSSASSAWVCPEFVDGIVEDVDRIKAFAEIGRPSLRFIDLDKCEKHVKPIAFFGALACTPASLDLGQRSFVILLGADRPDVYTSFPSVLRYGQWINAVVLGMGPNELDEGHLTAEIEGDHPAIISSCNFEPHLG